MDKRLKDSGYLMALGHNAIATREGRRVDHCHDLDGFDVDPIAAGVDLCAVRMALGEKSPEDWFAHYADESTFAGGMTSGVKALILGYVWEHGTPIDYTACLACTDGCERCNWLGIVPEGMVVTCPACGGEGSTPRDGACGYCKGEGLVWSADADDILTDVQGWDDLEATNRSMMGEI